MRISFVVFARKGFFSSHGDMRRVVRLFKFHFPLCSSPMVSYSGAISCKFSAPVCSIQSSPEWLHRARGTRLAGLILGPVEINFLVRKWTHNINYETSWSIPERDVSHPLSEPEMLATEFQTQLDRTAQQERPGPKWAKDNYPSGIWRQLLLCIAASYCPWCRPPEGHSSLERM